MEFISRETVLIIELSSSAQSRKELTPSTGLESGVERTLNKGKKK
jgi:hypothetical protein